MRVFMAQKPTIIDRRRALPRRIRSGRGRAWQHRRNGSAPQFGYRTYLFGACAKEYARRDLADETHELKGFVALALTDAFVVVLLRVAQIFAANLEVVGLPPRRGHVDVSLGAGDDHIAFRLNAAAHLQRGGCMRIEQVALRPHARSRSRTSRRTARPDTRCPKTK